MRSVIDQGSFGSLNVGRLCWFVYLIMSLLEIAELKKSYLNPDGKRQFVVDIPAFQLAAKEQVALSGTSGSGKTTFLNLIAGIVPADEGSIRLDEVEITKLNEARRDQIRAQHLGYIFQTFNLLQGFNCLENVTLGMAFGGKVNKKHAEELLERVGLGDRMRHFPRQLSTGQQQRVAVARALANRPQLVLADEPTGNLDPDNAREALSLIRETCRETGAALLLVSHDQTVLSDFEVCNDLRELNHAGKAEVTA